MFKNQGQEDQVIAKVRSMRLTMCTAYWYSKKNGNIEIGETFLVFRCKEHEYALITTYFQAYNETQVHRPETSGILDRILRSIGYEKKKSRALDIA